MQRVDHVLRRTGRFCVSIGFFSVSLGVFLEWFCMAFGTGSDTHWLRSVLLTLAEIFHAGSGTRHMTWGVRAGNVDLRAVASSCGATSEKYQILNLEVSTVHTVSIIHVWT